MAWGILCVCGVTEGWAAYAEVLAGGGTEAWSRIAACKMCQDRGMWDPQLPQAHPVTPAAVVMLSLIPPSPTFGLDDPALVFPSTSSCGSPFLPTLKESQLWGHGISTGFVVMGSRIQAFLTVAACPSSVAGSDPAGVKGVPRLLLCPTPGKSVLWHPCCCV